MLGPWALDSAQLQGSLLPASEGSVARSKSKQKIKRHRRNVKYKHRIERKKLARSRER